VRLMARLIMASALLCAGVAVARATPPADRLAVLRHGVNLTNWFRFPARADDDALRSYLSDAAMTALHRAGFGFVRLAVQPELLEAAPQRLALLVQAVSRLQRHGLAVVVAAHPATWHLEASAADRGRLLAFWQRVAPALRPLDPRLTYPEILNEPVFAEAPAAWEALQRAALAEIRTALPDATVVLTGADWGSVDGLTALHPLADRNVIYSFHFYEPPELTALASYRPGLDRAALARLPFPMNETGCHVAQQGSDSADTRALITFVCGLHWDVARIDARFARAADWGQENHAAVLLGEFGATRRLNTSARLAWLTAVRQACEQRGIGWALWGYDDSMGFGIDPRAAPTPAPDIATLTALGLGAGE
jgi:endoglucanase